MPFRSLHQGRGSVKTSSTATPLDRRKALWNRISITSDLKFDLLVICEDGLKVWCHQAVLASVSKGIAELLNGQGVMARDGSWRTEEVTILMPDVHSKDLRRVLCLLYNGYATVTVKAAEQLKKVWKQLGIDIVRLNNKEKIEVVNIENMEGMEHNKYFIEEGREAKVKAEELSLEESVNMSPVRMKRDQQELDQSTYFTPGNNISTSNTPRNRSSSNTPRNRSAFDTPQNISTTKNTPSSRGISNTPSNRSIFDTPQIISTSSNTPSSRRISNTHSQTISNTKLEDPLADPDDPPYEPEVAEKAKRGRKRKNSHNASSLPIRTFSSSIPLPTRTLSSSSIPLPTRTLSSNLPKKTKIECGSGSYYVEEIHTCLLCNGKTPDGRVDKEASNLSFREIKRLREHYSKHLYTEGKIFKQYPAEPGNLDADGKVVDEFGAKYKYTCQVKNCWKSKKPACGYKEMALHNAAEHEVLENVLAADERPVLKRLLEQIEEAKEKEKLVTKPLSCIIPECPDNETLFTNHGGYQSLKGHYSSQHWKDWFMADPELNQPRTQKVKEPRRGTPCDVCQAKVFGDESSMIEHYAVAHDKLVMGIMDVENSGVKLEHSKAVLLQLFPEKMKEFEKKTESESS